MGGRDQGNPDRVGLERLQEWIHASPGARVAVLIDGRAGTGKSTLARALQRGVEGEVVHLDDMYPGWDGLHNAAHSVAHDLLEPHAAGGIGRWRRWDWERSEPAEWHEVAPSTALIVEGCGALSRKSAALSTHRVWLEAPDQVRYKRAIARDGELFARNWDRWARQEDAFIALESPSELADVVLEPELR